jgi:phage tail sheath protein FI
MTALLHPGVYVLEIPSGARAIEGVPTSTAIFVGETERGPIGPTKINGRTSYERLFGGHLRTRDGGVDPTRVLMRYAIDGFFANGGSSAYILRAMDGWQTATPASRNDPGSAGPVLDAAWPGIWGRRVSTTFAASSDGDPNRYRVAVFYNSPQTGTQTLVEDWDRVSPTPSDESYVVDVLRRSQYVRWHAGADPADINSGNLDNNQTGPSETQLLASAVALTGGSGGGGTLSAADYRNLMTERLAEVDDAALLVAASDQLLPGGADRNAFVGIGNEFTTYADGRPKQDLFFVGDLPRLNTEVNPVTAAVNHARGGVAGVTAATRTTFNALYWPHLVVSDPVGAGRNPTLVVPPSGHVAGLYSRVDARRGVWKAPAGVETVLGGVVGLDFRVLDHHQDDLNPNAVNAIRQIPAAGNVVWGTRTCRPNSEWRYIPVRRTAMFLRKSIYNGIQWAVFEPNDEPLWQSLRATIGGFMEIQFRNGAFQGRTSRQAYFVKCDAETTTEDDRAAGIVNILVGFAPLRPAEFVVLRLSQKVNQAA